MNTEKFHIRETYAKHHRTIESGAQFRACLRAGPYAWPGGYQLAFVTSDGALLCFGCARSELFNITDAMRSRSGNGWRVVGLTGAHAADESACCDHCSKILWHEGQLEDAE